MYTSKDDFTYQSYSMSRNAVIAYENDEMPKSKWTKKAMIDKIIDTIYLEFEHDMNLDDIEKMVDELINKPCNKNDVFYTFFEYKGYHHTGKFYKITYFYGVDEKYLLRFLKRKGVDIK